MDLKEIAVVAFTLLVFGGALRAFLRQAAQPESVAQRGDAERLGALLEAEPGLVKRRFAGGFTLLHHAGSRDVAALLFARGADVEAPTDEGWTPLHMAAMHNNGPLAEQLLARGAKADVRDKRGKTPLDLAGGSEPVSGVLAKAGGGKGEGA